jgi:hypothetical protein
MVMRVTRGSAFQRARFFQVRLPVNNGSGKTAQKLCADGRNIIGAVVMTDFHRRMHRPGVAASLHLQHLWSVTS